MNKWREYWAKAKKRVNTIVDGKVHHVDCLHCQAFHSEATVVYSDNGRFFYCRLCNKKSRLPPDEKKHP